jgi:hypothetical protein
LAAGAHPPVGDGSGAAESFFQALARQTLASLDVGGIILVGNAAVLEATQSLNAADNLAARSAWGENLPDEALEGQAQVEDAVSAVEPFVGGGEQGWGEKVG